MRLEWSKSAVRASLAAALAARLFCGLALDAAEAGNAAWMAAPLGLMLSLPILWLMARCPRRALAVPLCLGLILDAAAAIEWTAFSESCLAFDHVSPVWMTLPLLLVALRCAWLGGDAVGGAARFWFGLFAALMLAVFLCQLPRYNPGWLTPWLGYGAGGVQRASIRAAGWIALLSGAAMAVCEERLSLRNILPGAMSAAIVAGLLLALRQMMAPVMLSGDISRSVLVDALLTNGRAPLYLQLPMIALWFAGMLQLIAFESVAACGLVRRFLPRATEGACVLVGLGAVSLLALTRTPRAEGVRQAALYLYHALAVAALLLRIWKGGAKKCAGQV